MKKLAGNITDFEQLVQGNYFYVDKTEYLWKLIRLAGESYLLHRPSQMGISLLLSTLKAIFQGKKELFRGLAIYDKPYDWTPYRVIHLDFNDCRIGSVAELQSYLKEKLLVAARELNLNPADIGDSRPFSDLILSVAENRKQIVILIDGYDVPVFRNLGNPEVDEIQKSLMQFYAAIKAYNRLTRFVMITGKHPFQQEQLTGEMNHLFDISEHWKYPAICGYTSEELKRYLEEWIQTVKAPEQSTEDFIAEMEKWYGGYCFHEQSATVSNPASIAAFAEHAGIFACYRKIELPAVIRQLIRKQQPKMTEVIHGNQYETIFQPYSVWNPDLSQLLIQEGILTVKEYAEGSFIPHYKCGFPNLEIEKQSAILFEV